MVIFYEIDKNMTMKLPEGKCYLTVYVGREMMQELDKLRGEVPRNKVVRRAINQFLERETKNLQGSRFDSPASQAVTPTPTTPTPDLHHHTTSPRVRVMKSTSEDDSNGRRSGSV
jgi:hypothetical protein